MSQHAGASKEAMTTAGLNLIQQALSICDNDLKLVVCNRRFKEMFDLPEALVTPGALFEDMVRHLATTGEYGEVDDIEEFVQARVEQAQAFEPHYMERTRSNGRTISVEGAPLPQGGWVSVYTDITGTKKQESLLRARSEELSDQVLAHAEELAATNRELEATIAALEEAKREITETEARTRLTTEMMPAHIAHVGTDGIYTYSNRRLNSVLPQRPSNILGLHIREALGEDAFGKIAPHLADAHAGTASVFEFTDKVSSRRIRVAFTPDTRDAGVQGVYILSMDITEETQARAALLQTRKRELAAQMTSGLAHDFSNLLTIILGLQGKLERMTMTTEARDLVTATVAAARRGGTLLNRLADMTGRRSPHPEPTDLRAFLADLVLLAGPTLPDTITLSVNSDVPDQPVLLDTGMVQDSLLNLILNARDACLSSRALPAHISLRATAVQGTWLELAVEDTGGGFSDKALEHATEPFFTTKGGEGTGLGLAMVYDMTKLAGGNMQLENTERGANVVLRLPLRFADTASVQGLVLLVEDSEELRAAVRDMLTDMGNSVVEAASVTEARDLLDMVPEIDGIVSDIMLEGDAPGLDLLPLARERGLRMVMMTSLPADHPLHVEARRHTPVLVKPFPPDALRMGLQSRPAA